jgi:hypothetical protein
VTHLTVCGIASGQSESYVSWDLVLCFCLESFGIVFVFGVIFVNNELCESTFGTTRVGAAHVGTVTRLPTKALVKKVPSAFPR